MNININGKGIELSEQTVKEIQETMKVIDNCEKELKILWDIN